MPKKQSHDAPGMLDATRAAQLLGVTPRWLRKLAADGHIPRAVRGRYPLVGVVQGYVRFLRDGSTADAVKTASKGLATAKAREIELRTSRAASSA